MSAPPLKRSIADAADADPPATPAPPLRRERAVAFHDAPPPGAVEAADAPMPDAVAPPPPEPPDGMALGVTCVHPLQPWVPMAFKCNEDLTSPWATPRTPAAHADGRTLVLLMVDLSPSMRTAVGGPNCGPGCAAACLVGVLEALPAYLRQLLPADELASHSLAIAGFSGTVGWVDQDHRPAETVFAHRTSGNWVQGSTIEAIEAQTVPLSGPGSEGLDEYIRKWVAKVKRIYAPDAPAEREDGHGTNIEAALYFAHRVAQRIGDPAVGDPARLRNTTVQVVLATDGAATIGQRSAADIRDRLDEVLYEVKPSAGPSTGKCCVPVQFHTLMMGNATRPEMLSDLMGSSGLLGYAKDPQSIASGLDTVLKPVLTQGKGLFEMITFTEFVDESGERVSELAMTRHAQGQFVGDNYTALYGARVPDKFHETGVNLPTVADAARLKLRVRGFCAPNLVRLADLMGPFAGDPTRLTLQQLLDHGHEALLDTTLPLSMVRWWAPWALRGPCGDYLRVPHIDQLSGQADHGLGGELRPSEEAMDRSPASLYKFLLALKKLAREINRDLGASRTHEEASGASQRYEHLMASREGSSAQRMHRRMAMTREASDRAAVDRDNDYQRRLAESETPDDPATQARMRSMSAASTPSASHYAAASLSQA